MNILMVTPVYKPKIGGIENYVEELSNQLKSKGYGVTICVVNNFYKPKIDKINGIDIYYIKTSGKYPFIFFKNLKEILNIDDFDIIHIHDPHLAGISFHFFLNNYRIPKVLSTHGGIFHNKNNLFIKNLYWHTVARLLIKQYKKVISISPLDYEHFKKITNNLKIIENGINTNKFQCEKIKPVNKTFIYFGRWSTNKGILQLIEVFKILFGLDKDIRLTLVGDSDDFHIKNSIKSFAESYPTNVRIFPFLEEKKLCENLCKHQFFITATNYEGFGISILEAISSGRIGIINDIPPLNKIFNSDEVFFVNFKNRDETIKKILQIIFLPESKLEEIKRKGIEKAKKYDWKEIFPKIENLYREVLK
jgi:alpha-1,3-mannosyltransferase